MPRRYRRRRGGGTLSRFIRSRAIGIMYVAMAGFVIGAISFLVSLIPATYIIVSDSGISVGSSVGSGATGFDLRVAAALIGGFGGLFLLISGARRLGVRI